MILAPLLALIALADDPTRPGLVALDFQDRPLPEVVREIGQRSGNALNLQHAGNIEANPLRVTLQAPAPVPFWEAVDLLCVASRLQSHLNDSGGLGGRTGNVSLYGPTDVVPPPACYSGPFRLGKFALHARHRAAFEPPIRPDPPEAFWPYGAEFDVMAEPRVIALRTGPLTDLVAQDDAGRSLILPDLPDAEGGGGPSQGYGLGAYGHVIRLRLAVPEPGARRLKLLKGRMPVEVGISPDEPALTIPLAESAGKVYSAGDVKLTVEDFSPHDGGITTLRVVARIEGTRGDPALWPQAVLWARSGTLQRQIEIVDEVGNPLQAAGGSVSPGEDLRIDYTFATPPSTEARPPRKLRLYTPDWVLWAAPFEFADLPLP